MWVTEHRTGNGTYKTYSEEPPKHINTSFNEWLFNKQPIASFSTIINDNQEYKKLKRKTNRRKK